MGVCGGTAPTPPGGQRPPLRKGAPSRGPGQLHLGPRAAAVRRLASKCTCGCDLGPLGRFTFSRPTGGERRAAVQAPLKRGLSPPPGGDWGFLVSCRTVEKDGGRNPPSRLRRATSLFKGGFGGRTLSAPTNGGKWPGIVCSHPSIPKNCPPPRKKAGRVYPMIHPARSSLSDAKQLRPP